MRGRRNDGLPKQCKSKHGHAKKRGGQQSRTYQAWCNMIGRCSRPTRADFAWYGGRGISVCERWLTFDNFLVDMGEKPQDSSLDRIDNDRGYEPGNCRWVTNEINSQNRSSTRLNAVAAVLIRVIRRRGATLPALGNAFGVHSSTISTLVRGETWRNALDVLQSARG